MEITARLATSDDLSELMRMYRALETEQTDLRYMWALADGLPEPAETSLKAILEDPNSRLIIGEIDTVPVGFLWMRPESLLPQANGDRVAVARLVSVDPEARGVGVGEAMITRAMDDFRARGFRRFDSRVSPGHRLAKNFFEANGFAARLIVMHHTDEEL